MSYLCAPPRRRELIELVDVHPAHTNVDGLHIVQLILLHIVIRLVLRIVSLPLGVQPRESTCQNLRSNTICLDATAGLLRTNRAQHEELLLQRLLDEANTEIVMFQPAQAASALPIDG